MREEIILKVAAELIDTIQNESRPASETINYFTRTHKSFGSKDRRLLTDTVWNFLRLKARLDFIYPTKTTLEKIYLSKEPLPPLDETTPLSVRLETPDWIIQKINNAEQELTALLETPKIILRATTDRDFVQQQLKDEGIETLKTPLSPFGLILEKRTNLLTSKTYKDGLVEVQDEGSQLVALETGIKKGDVVLDYCAGAGGKSLIFSQMMQGNGKIVSHDISKKSLEELKKRAQRNKVNIIETTTNIPAYLKQHPETKFSHVVVDAPCSGTGTWRRCPDARWKLTPEQFDLLLKKQAAILKKASTYLSNGGYLSYMTCSITNDENILQVRKFLKQNKTFKLITHKQFSPFRTNTDGLFVAIMQKTNEKE